MGSAPWYLGGTFILGVMAGNIHAHPAWGWLLVPVAVAYIGAAIIENC